MLDDGSPEGPAAIVGDPIFVYDLGTLIVIDKVLFGSEVELTTTEESQETTTAVPEVFGLNCIGCQAYLCFNIISGSNHNHITTFRHERRRHI